MLDCERNVLDLDHWEATSVSGAVSTGLQFTVRGLSGVNGTQFGLLPDNANNSFDACSAHERWVPAIDWAVVKRGTFACIRTIYGRRGVLRIDLLPDLEDDDPYTVLTGTIWEREV